VSVRTIARLPQIATLGFALVVRPNTIWATTTEIAAKAASTTSPTRTKAAKKTAVERKPRTILRAVRAIEGSLSL